MKKILKVNYLNGQFSSATYYHIDSNAYHVQIKDYNDTLFIMNVFRKNKAQKTMLQFKLNTFKHCQFDSIEYRYSK